MTNNTKPRPTPEIVVLDGQAINNMVGGYSPERAYLLLGAGSIEGTT